MTATVPAALPVLPHPRARISAYPVIQIMSVVPGNAEAGQVQRSADNQRRFVD
jgi:hypothetical protein